MADGRQEEARSKRDGQRMLEVHVRRKKGKVATTCKYGPERWMRLQERQADTSVWMRLVCTRTDGQCTGPIPWQVKAHSELPSPTTMVTRVLETDEMRPLECRRGTQWLECLAPTARYIVARIALLPIPREGSRLGGFLRRRRPVTTLPGQGLPCLIRTRPGECQGQPEVSAFRSVAS